MLSCPPTDDPAGSRLETAIAGYLQAEEAGDAPSRDEWLARFPELAEELSAFFACREAVPRLWSAQAAGQGPSRFGDYELLERIAQGGMGVVYSARHTRLNRTVALKLILSGQLATRANIERFQAEAQAAAGLDHPHIVPIYEVGQFQGQHFYTMKLVDGGSLADSSLIPRTLRSEAIGSKTKQRNIARLMARVAEAVHYAHQRGILHRDLKPSNILIDAQGQPYVADFGLAKRFQADESLTMSGLIVGTPLYMAPEQAAGKTVTTAADVYSLGAILYWLLTGKPAIQAATPLEALQRLQEHEPIAPRAIAPHVDRDLETICLKCLEKNPSNRYASAAALADDLNRWLSGDAIEARPSGKFERVVRRCRRNPAAATLGLAVILTAALGFFGVLSQWQVALVNERRAIDNEQQAIANATKAYEKAQEAKQKTEEAKQERDEAQRQRDEVRKLNQQLVETQQQLQKTLYVAHMNLAQQAWDRGATQRVIGLLNEHRPKAGQHDLRGFEWHFLHRRAYAGVRVLSMQTGYVWAPTFSRDAKQLATSTSDNSVILWDLQTGTVIRTLKGHKGMPVGLAFSPDGKYLASTSRLKPSEGNAAAGQLLVWDTATGKELFSIEGHKIGPWGLTYSSDGSHLASATYDISKDSYDVGIRVRDAQTGEERLVIKDAGSINCLAFSPDGRRIVSGGGFGEVRQFYDKQGRPISGEVQMWDAKTGQKLVSPHAPPAPVTALAFSPDGKHLACGTLASFNRDNVRIWDGETGKTIHTFGHTEAVYSIAFSADSQRLATASADQTVKLWDVNSGKELYTATGHEGGVGSVAFTPDDERLLSTTSNGFAIYLKEADASTGESDLTIKNLPAGVSTLAYSPDGSLLGAVVGSNVKLWNSDSGKELHTLQGHEGAVYFAFRPDGKRLLSGAYDRTLKVWDTETGTELRTLKAHGMHVQGIAFSRDGRRAASADWDGVIKVWNADTWAELWTVHGHSGAIYNVAFSPDDKHLASASGDGTVKIWDSTTGKEVLLLTGPSRLFVGLAYSPNGDNLAAGCDDATTRVWETRTGKQILTLVGHTGRVNRLVYSPDGKRLATSSFDQTTKVWDAQTGQELLSFNNHIIPAFSPDSHRLAVGTNNKKIRILDARPVPEAIENAVNALKESSLPAFWRITGYAAYNYRFGVDKDIRHTGQASAFIKSGGGNADGFARLTQVFRADDFRGKRVRLSGYIKTENVDSCASLWLRLDRPMGTSGGDMRERPARGTTDWKQYEIVFDVPADTIHIAFGLALDSKEGQAWFDDLNFEFVGEDVKPTATLKEIKPRDTRPTPRAQAKPLNLGFEQ